MVVLALTATSIRWAHRLPAAAATYRCTVTARTHCRQRLRQQVRRHKQGNEKEVVNAGGHGQGGSLGYPTPRTSLSTPCESNLLGIHPLFSTTAPA